MVDQAEPKAYDYIVIGAGSGGMGSGRRAALLGKKVLMVENRVIGGTCVNVGCIPKKCMFNLAGFLEDAEIMKDYGVGGTEDLKLDFADFKVQRDAYIKRLNGIYENNLKKSDIDYQEGTASFVSDHVIEVEGKRFTAPHILIASGSYPIVHDFPGAEFCMTSDGFFEMDKLPKTMIVVGGGYIGVECGQIMQALGVKVTMIIRSKILGHIDRDIIELLETNMHQSGMEIRLQTKFSKVTQEQDGSLCMHLDTKGAIPEKIYADKILYATGRPPLVDALKLENTGVKIKNGSIEVDEYQNTTAEGVYAIGDVTNNFTLTPVAIRAGRILSERIFNNRQHKMLYKNIATVIFSHPPIGSLGYSEEEAIKEYGEEKIIVHKSGFINMFYSPYKKGPEYKKKCLFKLICLKMNNEEKPAPDQQKVIGLCGIGRGIDEMLTGLSIAVTMGATKQDFDNSVAIHPTAGEEWVLMDANFI